MKRKVYRFLLTMIISVFFIGTLSLSAEAANKDSTKSYTVYYFSTAKTQSKTGGKWVSVTEEVEDKSVYNTETKKYGRKTITYWTFVDSKGKREKYCKIKVDGKYYIMDRDGSMVTNNKFWIANLPADYDDERYYVYKDGHLATNETFSRKGLQCPTLPEIFLSDGRGLTGVKKFDDGYVYYLWGEPCVDEGIKDGKYYKNGYRKTGWVKYKGSTYYFRTPVSDGTMVKGWKKISGKWYFFDSEGKMKTGWLKHKGKRYYLHPTGIMLTGWKFIGGKQYYFNSNGVLQVGWKKISNRWYYFIDETPIYGVMQTDWLTYKGKKYYLGSDGVMRTGWFFVGKNKYYANTSGAIHTGWKKIGPSWYYFDPLTGRMQTNQRYINGKIYKFNSSGVCTNP